jgi:phospholipid transport system transporter-binding protein
VIGATLESGGRHRWVISGSLDFDTVPRLWNQLSGHLDSADWVLDLNPVSRANSAGLALLLQAHAESRRRGGRMHVEGLPASLRQLGAMSGLDGFLDELRG